MFNICITKNHNFTIWDWMRFVITAPCHQSLEAAQYSPHGNEQGSSSLPSSQVIVQVKDIMDPSKKALMEIA
jgi:hypothetical protein